MGPEEVWDKAPEGGDNCPAAVDRGYAATAHYGMFYARSCVVDAHLERKWGGKFLQEVGADEARAYVGCFYIDVLAAGELVNGLEVCPLVSFGGTIGC